MFFPISLYLAMAVFAFGLVYKISTLLTRKVGIFGQEFTGSQRLWAALRGVTGVVFSRKIIILLRSLILAERLGIETDQYGFARTSKMEPVRTSVPGIYVCGGFEAPMDIPSSVVESSAAAGMAASQLLEGVLHPIDQKCDGAQGLASGNARYCALSGHEKGRAMRTAFLWRPMSSCVR